MAVRSISGGSFRVTASQEFGAIRVGTPPTKRSRMTKFTVVIVLLAGALLPLPALANCGFIQDNDARAMCRAKAERSSSQCGFATARSEYRSGSTWVNEVMWLEGPPRNRAPQLSTAPAYKIPKIRAPSAITGVIRTTSAKTVVSFPMLKPLLSNAANSSPMVESPRIHTE